MAYTTRPSGDLWEFLTRNCCLLSKQPGWTDCVFSFLPFPQWSSNMLCLRISAQSCRHCSYSNDGFVEFSKIILTTAGFGNTSPTQDLVPLWCKRGPQVKRHQSEHLPAQSPHLCLTRALTCKAEVALDDSYRWRWQFHKFESSKGVGGAGTFFR